jgi:glutathione synthase/RimK-type ligase-like ATP-grasp enzyme
MIFQRYVPKSFEVRVTCFGATLVAAKLDSQAHASSRVDWRAISPTRLNVQPIELPPAVSDCCLELMRTLGLRFGCIDLVVTPKVEWVFLEINQMGQFLWLEELAPEFQLLDLFLQLLTGTIEDGVATARFGLDFEAIDRTARQILADEREGGDDMDVGNRVFE